MCEPTTLLTVAAIGLTVAGGASSAYSQYQTGAAQNKYYNQMAENSNTEAGYALAEGQQALKAGELQSKLIQDTQAQEGKALKTQHAEFNAASRAALAANGVYGVTAQDIETSNISKERLDEMALRYNADVKSWEVGVDAQYKNQGKKYSAWQSNIQADQYRYQGKAAAYAGKVGAFTTLLSTAASVAAMGAGGLGGAKGGTNLGAGTTSQGVKVPSRMVY